MVLADKPVLEVHDDDRLITSQMYKETFFSLVSETLFGEDKESLFITEKTFKPIAYRHPFMIVGSMGTLRHLRYLGYETFPEMFGITEPNVPNFINNKYYSINFSIFNFYDYWS